MSERIDDGFPTTVDFADISVSVFWEKTVTPPGLAGGGPNDTSTMRNTRWRTMSPKKLVTLTPMTLVAAYDPVIYDSLVAEVQDNQQITINFPDGSNVVFWGFIDDVSFGESAEGSQPTITITVQPSNQNDSGTETAPVYNAA